jgi:hypothetical protein
MKKGWPNQTPFYQLVVPFSQSFSVSLVELLTREGWGPNHTTGSNPHGLINYKDTKTKCCHLKKLTFQGTLRLVFIRVYRLEMQSVMLDPAHNHYLDLPVPPTHPGE